MARLLADRDVQKLLGSVIANSTEELLNPNGIELRLGRDVLFHSTGEEAELSEGMFLKVCPGESVVISSLESIDFSIETVERILPNKMLMGFITPTTTMMREGISQVATKIDAGFRGSLNWGLRNGSVKDLIIRYGEPIFKLTIFVLEGDERPEFPYGSKPAHRYQDSEGVVRSGRQIPADIPKRKLVSSGFAKLDPKKQLKEAGYPFDHISTELTDLHGKFEVVSSDVRMMKDEFQQRTDRLEKAIEKETAALSTKIEEGRNSILEKVEVLFERKIIMMVGVIIGAGPIMYGALSYAEGRNLNDNTIAFLAILVGAVMLAFTAVLAVRRPRSSSE